MIFCRKCYNTQTKQVLDNIYPCKHAPVTVLKLVCSKCNSTVFTKLSGN